MIDRGQQLLITAARTHAHPGCFIGMNFVECPRGDFHAHLDPRTGDYLIQHGRPGEPVRFWDIIPSEGEKEWILKERTNN